MTAQQDHLQPRMRQLVDWEAAAWGGLIAGILTFLFAMLFFNSTDILNVLAAPVLRKTLTDGFTIEALFAGLGVHMLLSILFSFLIAFTLHRGGLIVGILGGAVMGLTLYGFNFYALPYLLPTSLGRSADLWLFQEMQMGMTHIFFGAVAGGIYEWLEVEEYVPA